MPEQNPSRSARETLSVAMVACNEEANVARTLSSVINLADEIIFVDSGSTDRTLEIASSFGPKVKIFHEPWKGFPRQKNSAIDKATGDWILLLDADESLTPELQAEIAAILSGQAETPRPAPVAYRIARRNYQFGRWIRHGGHYPDPKRRLMRKGAGRVEDCPVNEELQIPGLVGDLHSDLIHHAHSSIADYIEHANRYSSLGAEMKAPRGFSLLNIVLNPFFTFIYNYFFRLGFLDGAEGLLLHLYHSTYVSLKYAKAWELTRNSKKLEN
ncbi:MAG: glycosyltransferase family 2 protein [Acidobacteria bacterium]|nr:MAG: glycosyltransferase family 2 protein [Acidobacteriota bacterium]